MIDESVDERLQNSRRPEIDDSDESTKFDKTILAMVNSTESSATVFDGAKCEVMDELRVKLGQLREFLRETVAAHDAMAPQSRTRENYDARDKLVDDVATIVSKNR